MLNVFYPGMVSRAVSLGDGSAVQFGVQSDAVEGLRLLVANKKGWIRESSESAFFETEVVG